jgi:hypothetical protein
MKPEKINNNHVKIMTLIAVMNELMSHYVADREIRFYIEHDSVKRIYSGRMKNITFGDLVTALAMTGYTDLTDAQCRVTTFDNDDMMVITII